MEKTKQQATAPEPATITTTALATIKQRAEQGAPVAATQSGTVQSGTASPWQCHLDRWHALSEEATAKLGHDAAGVPNALGFGVMMLDELAQDCQEGKLEFQNAYEALAMRAVVQACNEAMRCITEAVAVAEADLCRDLRRQLNMMRRA